MTYARLCEHGRFEAHDNRDADGWLILPHPCPGGSVLADDLLPFSTEELIAELVRRDEWPLGIPATPIKSSWWIEEPS
jgi:hypothetical protein